MDVVVEPSYTLPTAVLLESFGSAADFVALSGGTFVDDPARKIQGVSASRIKSTSGSAAMFGAKNKGNMPDPANMGVVAFYIDHDPFTISNINFQIGRANARYAGTPISEGFGDNQPRGGRWLARNISEFGTLPAGEGNMYIRTRVDVRSPGNAELTIDSAVYNAKGRPTFLITFDDGYRGPLINGMEKLDRYGAKATFYIPPSLIGGFGRLTEADLAALNAAGHDLACDSMGDAPFTNFGTPAGAVAHLQEVRDWLSSRSFTRAIDHMCYPDGTWQADVVQATATVTCDGTNTVVLSAAPTTPITVGMNVYGFGAGPNTPTTVTAVDGLNITVSRTIAATTTRLKFVDQSSPFFGRALPDAFLAAGMKTGRITRGGANYTRFGFGQQAMTLIGQGETGSSWAKIKSHIDNTLLRGDTLIWYFHNVTEAGGSIDISTALFAQIMDYIGPMKLANEVDILTISQLYERDKDGALRLPA